MGGGGLQDSIVGELSSQVQIVRFVGLESRSLNQFDTATFPSSTLLPFLFGGLLTEAEY